MSPQEVQPSRLPAIAPVFQPAALSTLPPKKAELFQPSPSKESSGLAQYIAFDPDDLDTKILC